MEVIFYTPHQKLHSTGPYRANQWGLKLLLVRLQMSLEIAFSSSCDIKPTKRDNA